jgi:hypothetical protein
MKGTSFLRFYTLSISINSRSHLQLVKSFFKSELESLHLDQETNFKTLKPLKTDYGGLEIKLIGQLYINYTDIGELLSLLNMVSESYTVE